MKSHMLFLTLLFLTSPSHALFGLLGRDQCNYQQSAYPTYQNDNQHALKVQIQGLETQRGQMEARFAQISSEGLRLQAGIRGYIHSPWSETMLAHIDNNLDCCAPTTVYAILNLNFYDQRRPAGQDLNTPEYNETPTPVDPVGGYVEPPPYIPPKKTNSCQGYPAQFCSNNWGTPYSEPKPGAGLCLQTGFAATPAWYQAACRNGGKIDTQVCSNPQIAKDPSQYQQCIQMLSAYQNLSGEKRQLAAHIQEMNTSINNVRYSATGNPNYTPSGETKNGFLSGVGNLLGSVISTLGPFMLNQYMSYQQQKSSSTYAPGSRMAKYGPPRRVTNVDGSLSSPRDNPRPYYQHPQPPPPYYGPRYGYPFNYAGNYGALLPGYQQGGFGCTPGTSNNGMSLVSTLLGGLGLNLNANTNIQSNFGPNGGHTPYQAYLNAYGNQYAGVPPYTFPGYTPPYQPGSIYGTTPTYRPPYATPYGYQSIPNYYSRYNINYQPPTSVPEYNPPYMYSPTNYANNQPATNNFGWQYNSYYYAQQMNNQRMILENDARMRQRQMDVQLQVQQLQRINSSFQYQPQYQNTSYLSNGYTTPYTYNSNSYNQVDMKSLLQGLLTGQSAYFNVNMNAN